MTALVSQAASGGIPLAPRRVADLIAAKREGISIRKADLPAEIVGQIEQHLAACGRASAPCAPQQLLVQVMIWLRALTPFVANAPEGEEAKARCRAIVEICGDLPMAVWCEETRRAWVCQPGGAGKFFPTPSELYALLQPFADAIRRDQIGCESLLVLARTQAEPGRVPPTEAEKAAVAETLARWRAEAAEKTAEREPVTAQPCYLSDGQLLQVLKRETPHMTGRIQALEAKIAREAAAAAMRYAAE